jgi:hypothetical protein
MITSVAIKSALNKIASDLKDCKLICSIDPKTKEQKIKTIYDPQLTFLRSWSKNKKPTVLIEDKIFNPLDVIKRISHPPDLWSMMTWNRGQMDIDSRYGLKSYSFATPVPTGNGKTVNTYKARMVQTPLTVKFYTNNGNLMEQIEETIMALYTVNNVFDTPVEHIGSMTTVLSPLEGNTIEKLDTKTTGQVFEYQCEFSLYYMLFADGARNLPLIKRAFINVNVGTLVESEFDIGFKKDVETGEISIYREKP